MAEHQVFCVKLQKELPGTTRVSIGHRAELARFHARMLAWKGMGLNPG